MYTSLVLKHTHLRPSLEIPANLLRAQPCPRSAVCRVRHPGGGIVSRGPGQRTLGSAGCWAGGNSEGVLAASPVTRYRPPAALLSKCFLAPEPLSTQMLFPFTLDRRCPVVRRGARGLRLLPARPSDDRELPAVPSAQSLEVWWPLHEFYKRGKSMICNHNCFPLTQNFPSRSSAAAQHAGMEARGREVWQV